MEEKVLIKAVFSKLKFLVVLCYVIAAILFVIGLAIGYDIAILYLTASSVFMVFVGVILGGILKMRELIVTNKRVIARGAFGYRADLPIEKITDVSMCWFNGIGCASPSTRIKFHFCKNKTEVFDTIISESLQRDSKYQ